MMSKPSDHGLTTRVHVSSWKLAVNDFSGGRLIFCDIGMIGRYISLSLCVVILCVALHPCSISQNIRESLHDLFHRVYQKHRKKVVITNFVVQSLCVIQ